MFTTTTATEVHPCDEARPYQWPAAHMLEEYPSRLAEIDERAHQTIEVCDAVHFYVGMVFAEGNAGVVISWPEDHRSYDDDVRAQVSALWAEDWDSEEDAVYDNW